MKECPNCREEMEDSYDLCCNCNYSIIEKKVVKFTETEEGERDINCIRCNIYPLNTQGNISFTKEVHPDSLAIFLNYLSTVNPSNCMYVPGVVK